MKQYFLYPGNLIASKEPAQISTILGSCVGVAICDPHLKVGGLNHYLLPTPPQFEKPSYRHGSIAIPGLVDSLIELGADRSRLRAKVYGGAALIGSLDIGTGIGKMNIEIALAILGELGIPVDEQNTGGTSGRRIKLDTGTFDVKHVISATGSSAA